MIHAAQYDLPGPVSVELRIVSVAPGKGDQVQRG
jgi:hypothetical protein